MTDKDITPQQRALLATSIFGLSRAIDRLVKARTSPRKIVLTMRQTPAPVRASLSQVAAATEKRTAKPAPARTVANILAKVKRGN